MTKLQLEYLHRRAQALADDLASLLAEAKAEETRLDQEAEAMYQEHLARTPHV